MPHFNKLLPKFLLGAMLILSNLTLVQAQSGTAQPPGDFSGLEYDTVLSSGGSGAEQYQAVRTDSAGNSYMLVLFQGQGKFGSITRTAPGAKWEYGLLKLNPAGDAVWYRKIKRLDDNQLGVYDVALHTDGGGNSWLAVTHPNVDTIGTAVISLLAGRQPVTITKFDASGTQLWANWVAAGNTPNTTTRSIQIGRNRPLAVLPNGQIVLGGTNLRSGFNYFNGGATVQSVGYRPFLLKLSATGTFVANMLTVGNGTNPGNLIMAVASKGDRLYMAGIKVSDTLTFPKTGGGTFRDVRENEQASGFGNAVFSAQINPTSMTVNRIEYRREFRYLSQRSLYNTNIDLAARSDSGLYILARYAGATTVTDTTHFDTGTIFYNESKVYSFFGAPTVHNNGYVVDNPVIELRKQTIFGNVVYGVDPWFGMFSMDIQADNSLLVRSKANSFPDDSRTVTKIDASGNRAGTVANGASSVIASLNGGGNKFILIGTYTGSVCCFPTQGQLNAPGGAAGTNGYWAKFGAVTPVVPVGCNIALSSPSGAPGQEIAITGSSLAAVHSLYLSNGPLPFRRSNDTLYFTVPVVALTGTLQAISGVDSAQCIGTAAFTVLAPTERRISAAPISACNGIYTDPSGAAFTYTNNIYVTQTISPTTAGAKLQLDFSSLQLNDNDQIYVYNGTSPGSPLLYRSVGGSIPPGKLVSTHPSGALTVRFYTNAAGIGDGFVATISCPAGGAASPQITSFTPQRGVNGQKVMLTGNNLNGATKVHFAGYAASFTVKSALQVEATVPVSAKTGYIWIETPNGAAATPVRFTVTDSVVLFNGQTAMCAGSFADPQGANANYAPSLYLTQTISPSVAGRRVALDFNQFDIAAGDYMYIYNGATASSPLLVNYRGGVTTVVPDTVRSTTGSLTVRFYSDASLQGAGWLASIFCLDALPAPSPSAARLDNGPAPTGLVETFAFWPNPAKDKLTLRLENVEAKTLVLFNAQGKAAYQAPIGQGVTELALPRLAPGLYIVQVGRHTARLAVE